MSKTYTSANAYVDLPSDRMPDSILFSAAGTAHTDQIQAEQFYANNPNNFVWKRDLSSFEQVRLSARILTGSVSVNSPRLRLRYRLASAGLSTVTTDYVDIGITEVACSLTTGGTTTYVDSGWIALAPAAKADVFVTVMQLGGNATADPQSCNVLAEFR